MTQAAGQYAASPAAQRVVLLDVLRGFALLGIIQVNWIAYFNGLRPSSTVLTSSSEALDVLAWAWQSLFVEGKFYPIFAFLFGYGFCLQWRALERRAIAVRPLLARRFVWLLVIGILHGTLLYFGDILTLYALAGLVLVAQGLGSRAEALRMCAFWAVVSLALAVLDAVTATSLAFGTATVSPFSPGIWEGLALGAHGQLVLVASAREAFLVHLGWYLESMRQGSFIFLPQILLFMSLGVSAAHMGVLQHPRLYRVFWTRLLWIAATFGLAVNLAYTWFGWLAVFGPRPEQAQAVASCLYDFVALLCPLYIVLCIRLVRLRVLSKLVAALAASGKLALSNYLGQSLFMLVAFFFFAKSRGPGWHVYELTVSGLLVAVLQIVVAPIYLRRFPSGPAEHLWRLYTYRHIKRQS